MNQETSTQIGLLHSLTGTMALSEKSLLDAEMMAIAEVNAGGGILGRQLDPVVMDGESVPEVFASRTGDLLTGGVKTIFGAWTSASRKAIKPLLEQAGGLLFYPVQYEGLEESPNIVYTGSCLNQQIETAMNWALLNCGTKFFLVGSDYVFPRAANRMIRSMVEQQGGQVLDEEFFEMGHLDFASVVERIRNLRPDVVFNTLNGDSNIGFFQQFDASGLTANEVPVMSVSINETEVQVMGGCATGHLACWGYFQSLQNDENLDFIGRFTAMYGHGRVCTAPMIMAYSQLWLWKQAVEIAGSFDPLRVARAIPGCKLNTPAGMITINSNNHASKKMRIGRVNHSGHFDVIWESDDVIHPLPWLGLEEAAFSRKALVRDCMASYPDLLHQYSDLEKQIHKCLSLEQELKQLNEDLENKVNSRTNELHDSVQALQVAKNQAEEASKLKSSLLLNMSHELRTPINGILGFGDLLIGILEDQRQKSMVNNMVQMGKRLLVTFTSMLKLSRLEAEKVKPVLELCNISEFVGDEVNRFKGPASVKKIEIKTDIAGQIICNVDRPMFGDILFFILDNAVKYTDEGYIWVKLKKATIDGIACAQLTIKDTGIGIADDQMQYIFDAFRQGSEGIGRAYDGAGLGLTLCRKLLSVLDGRVAVESTLGAGSTFTITLPVVEKVDPVLLVKLPERDKLVTRVIDWFSAKEPKRRVLIVEDNMINAALLVQYMEEFCYTDIAKNGQLALKYAWQYDYDIILMDINLGPGIDGIQTTREIRALKNYGTIPVIAVTGYSTDDEKQHIMSNGLDAFISKPFTQDELLIVIGKALRIV